MKLILLLTLAAIHALAANGQRRLSGKDTVALHQLDVFRGVWVILVDRGRDQAPDTTCRTTCQWSPHGTCLICDQLIFKNKDTTTNLCVYTFDAKKQKYRFYYMNGSDQPPGYENLKIDSNRWEYYGQAKESAKTVLYRTINYFNDAKNEDLFEVQYSEDEGRTWITTKRGMSKKLQSN